MENGLKVKAPSVAEVVTSRMVQQASQSHCLIQEGEGPGGHALVLHITGRALADFSSPS
jgi:hypothetical protein